MTDPPRVPDHARHPHEDFPDVPTGVAGPSIPARKSRIYDFYDDLMHNPELAATTALFKAIAAAYARGDKVQDICAVFGVTRSEVATVVRIAGVSRGMDTLSMAPVDVANLYALLFAAQLEIESLREQLGES